MPASRRPPREMSLLGMGSLGRLACAGLLAGLAWAAVFWAVG